MVVAATAVTFAAVGVGARATVAAFERARSGANGSGTNGNDANGASNNGGGSGDAYAPLEDSLGASNSVRGLFRRLHQDASGARLANRNVPRVATRSTAHIIITPRAPRSG